MTSRCWLCDSMALAHSKDSSISQRINADSIRISDDHYGQTLSLVKCRDCGLVFVHPSPESDFVDLYRGMVDGAYLESSIARRSQMRKILATALRYKPDAERLIDIGAATGLLVSEATRKGLHALGIEPSRWCVEIAERIEGVKLFCGTLEEYPHRLEDFDIVTLIDVVEHTRDPLGMVRKAAEMLRPGGVLLMSTPDIGSMAAHLMRTRWWHFRPAHVCYFSKKPIRYILQKAELNILDIRRIGWRFPTSYLIERLARYLPFQAARSFCQRLGNSRFLSGAEIYLNLGDSVLSIAQKNKPPGNS